MTLETIDPKLSGARPAQWAHPDNRAFAHRLPAAGAVRQRRRPSRQRQRRQPAPAAAPPAKPPRSDKHVFSDTVTEIYDGTWTATFDRSVGPTGTAKFVLEDFAGTWQDVGPADRLKGSACGAKSRPVTVQLSQKEGFAFTVFGTHVSPQCQDLTVYVKHVDEKTLEGTVESKAFAGEQKIRLVRTSKAPRRR